MSYADMGGRAPDGNGIHNISMHKRIWFAVQVAWFQRTVCYTNLFMSYASMGGRAPDGNGINNISMHK